MLSIKDVSKDRYIERGGQIDPLLFLRSLGNLVLSIKDVSRDITVLTNI